MATMNEASDPMTEVGLASWVGRNDRAFDRVSPTPVAALAATLDRSDPPPQDGDVLPPLWHWLYFLPCYRTAEAGPDGHVRRGGFLPPIPLPRRMWAGGRLTFHAPLHVGEAIVRDSQIVDITQKTGRSGPLAFVVVRHTISGESGVAIVEEHDIVYRDEAKAGQPASGGARAPVDAAWSHEIHPDPVLLFRYSALTFNSHRIHYDRRHVTDVERYPGLVVHGPLIATLLVDLLRRAMPHATLSAFSFRATSPLFDGDPFFVRGQPAHDHSSVRLWAASPRGALAMDATATIA
ncbi:MAG TPA: MaoC family dehydratase N-terminal domain-containing protein [Casimicrobiaceae bacterium]|nr:MaoC family dehydratase N-terminal domain-containing protein [Casimicrobiaceae bacterium]